MKTFVFASALLFTTFANAHGPVARQASAAIDKSTNLFVTAHPKEIYKKFKSVSAENTGHEKFFVEIKLTDNSVYAYDCGENEDVDPVVWECVTH